MTPRRPRVISEDALRVEMARGARVLTPEGLADVIRSTAHPAPGGDLAFEIALAELQRRAEGRA